MGDPTFAEWIIAIGAETGYWLLSMRSGIGNDHDDEDAKDESGAMTSAELLPPSSGVPCAESAAVGGASVEDTVIGVGFVCVCCCFYESYDMNLTYKPYISDSHHG